MSSGYSNSYLAASTGFSATGLRTFISQGSLKVTVARNIRMTYLPTPWILPTPSNPHLNGDLPIRGAATVARRLASFWPAVATSAQVRYARALALFK